MNSFCDYQFFEGEESHKQNRDLYQNDINNVQENNIFESDALNIYENRKSLNDEFNKIIIFNSENNKGFINFFFSFLTK